MDQNMQGDADTGTRDETYDVISVLYHALQGVENCELYAEDASDDQELRQFFDQACQSQRQLADQAKRILHDRLMRQAQGGGSGSGSAFTQFGSGSESGSKMAGGSGSGASSGSMGGSSETSGRSSSSGMSGGQDMGSSQDRQGGSAYTSGESVGAQGEDPSMSQFGQSGTGQGQRHNEMSTGGGGTSSF